MNFFMLQIFIKIYEHTILNKKWNLCAQTFFYINIKLIKHSIININFSIEQISQQLTVFIIYL